LRPPRLNEGIGYRAIIISPYLSFSAALNCGLCGGIIGWIGGTSGGGGVMLAAAGSG
jgi:hypothetical protein